MLELRTLKKERMIAIIPTWKRQNHEADSQYLIWEWENIYIIQIYLRYCMMYDTYNDDNKRIILSFIVDIRKNCIQNPTINIIHSTSIGFVRDKGKVFRLCREQNK